MAHSSALVHDYLPAGRLQGSALAMEVRETVDQIVEDNSHPEVLMIRSSVAVKA